MVASVVDGSMAGELKYTGQGLLTTHTLHTVLHSQWKIWMLSIPPLCR